MRNKNNSPCKTDKDSGGKNRMRAKVTGFCVFSTDINYNRVVINNKIQKKKGGENQDANIGTYKIHIGLAVE